jgi:hypothetical protein
MKSKSKEWKLKKLEKAIDALIDFKSEGFSTYDVEMALDKLNSLHSKILSE